MLAELNAEGERIRHVDDYVYDAATTVQKYELHNGLTVLLLADSTAPIFSYQTWFRVGSGYEKPGKTGIAHLFEHLMFKETKNTPEGVFDRKLEEVGARVNAATWLDWTFYYEDVPSAHLAMVVELEADRMEHMSLTKKQLEAEREVVINERRERVDNEPNGKLSEMLWKDAYQVHSYKNPTIGWMPDIEGLTLDDCVGFYKTYYAPNNAVVVVVGDVDRKLLLGMIVERYGHMEPQPIPKLEIAPEPAQTAARRSEAVLAISTDKLVVGYKGLAIADLDHLALSVLNDALAEGDSARLQRALVTEGEVASGFSTFASMFRDPGLYEISVDMRPGHKAEEAEAIIGQVFAEVVESGIEPAELEKARNRIETQFYRQLETAQQRAQGLGFWEVTTGDFRRLFTIAEGYRAVTLDDVHRVAKSVLRKEQSTTIVARPAAHAQ